MNNNQFEQLIRQMQDRVKSNPANADAWRDLAQAKMMAGDIDGAEDDCIECLRLNPQNVGGLILMGNLLTNCKKNDEAAIGYYEKAVAFGPKSPDAHCNLGTLYFKRGENIKGLVQLRQAIELKPDHAVAYVMLAHYYVSGARVLPDKLSLLHLPFDDAYAAAKSMYELKNRGNGDNSSKTTRGVIHRITYRLAA